MKKTCRKCKIEKEITEFYRNRRACKRCCLESDRRWREESKANHLYKVDCPGGYFYIGSTTQGIKVRSQGHRDDRCRLSKHIKENSLSKEDLKYSVVKEFEDPEEMKIAERELIRSSYTDPFLLNEIIPLRSAHDGPKLFCLKCKIEKPLEEFYYLRDKELYEPSCKQCKAVMGKEYYEANKEKIAKTKKEYHEANKEKILKTKKEYYEANKEKILKKNKKYYEASKEKILKKNKKYYEANKEKILKQKKEYRERKKLLDKQ